MKEISVSLQASSNMVFVRPFNLFLRRLLEQFKPFSENGNLLDSVELAFNEALVNVLKHSYHGQEDGTVEICITVGQGGLELRLTDSGTSFDPETVPEPDPDGLNERGMGLWIIRRIMDELHYSTDESGKNTLRLVKRLAEVEPDCGFSAL